MDLRDIDIIEFRNTLKDLRQEVEKDLIDNPEIAEDAIPLLTCIKRLQADLADVKNSEDFRKNKFLQCVPDLAFVMQSLNQILPEDDEFDEDDEDFDMEFEEDELELLEDDEEESKK